jgi:hypothetical protein
MNNLIDDPAYLQTKIDLRKALFAKLANAKGQHAVPFTERASQGQVFRSLDGARAAEFPQTWLRPANPVDRFDGLFPDSPAKLEAEKKGQPYFPRRQ